MITSFDEMYARLRDRQAAATVAVAAAQDKPVLEAVYRAHTMGICNAILVGDRELILHLQEECAIPAGTFEIVHVSDDPAATCDKAVELVRSGQAGALMKGLVETPILLKAVLRHKESLLVGGQMNHMAVLDIPRYHKLLFLSDGAMIIQPDLASKRRMIVNGLPVLRSFGITEPKIALICAKESVDPKMPATGDAGALTEMNRNGALNGCTISGPIAMDVAVSMDAAKHKGLADKVAGDADYLLVPTIEAGNILYKTLVQFAGARSAGIITGASVPIILTSRSDNADSKANSIAFACLAGNANP